MDKFMERNYVEEEAFMTGREKGDEGDIKENSDKLIFQISHSNP